jgi:thymidine kinase
MEQKGRLRFCWSAMGGGKTTLAVQTFLNLDRHGRGSIFLSLMSRPNTAVEGRILSELPSEKVLLGNPDYEFDALLSRVDSVDSLVIDDAHFLTRPSVVALTRWMDEYVVEVFAFGLLHDFRSCLFEGSQALLELADETSAIQTELRCWCGEAATHHLRLLDGEIKRNGPQVMLAGLEGEASASGIAYAVVCRYHWEKGIRRSAI